MLPFPIKSDTPANVTFTFQCSWIHLTDSLGALTHKFNLIQVSIERMKSNFKNRKNACFRFLKKPDAPANVTFANFSELSDYFVRLIG